MSIQYTCKWKSTKLKAWNIIFFSYGTTNQAFDPNPEQDINHGKLQSISDPSDAERQSSFDSLEDEESITPTPESEYITREGKSAFYGDQPNSENPDPVDGVENGLKDNHNETLTNN